MIHIQAHIMFEVWIWLGRCIFYHGHWQWRRWLKNHSHYIDLLGTASIPKPEKELIKLDAGVSFASK